MSDTQQYVTVESAARSTGISARTIRYWIANGKLTATAERRGKRVRLGDVMALATMTGRLNGSDISESAAAASSTGEPATAAADPLPPAVDEQQRQAQLELIRESLLRPLIEQNERQQERISELERDSGRLEAELAHAQLERLALQARVDAFEARESAVQSTMMLNTISPANAPPVATQRAWWRFWDR